MATRKNQLVVPFGNGWAVVVEGRKLFTVLTTRKSQAISYARNIAKEQKTDLIIYGKDLKIRERKSYRTAPQRPR